MPNAIQYYLTAATVGGVSVGGLGVAAHLVRRGQQVAAAETEIQHARSTDEVLQARIDLEGRRRQASAVGIDPDQVEQNYRRTRGEIEATDQCIWRLGALRPV